MSFDLAVWYAPVVVTAADAARKYAELAALERAALPAHPRISAFHRELTTRYPDLSGVPLEELARCPWASNPIVAGSGVLMSLSWSCADDVVSFVQELAERHELVLYDPQDGSAYPPSGPGGGT